MVFKKAQSEAAVSLSVPDGEAEQFFSVDAVGGESVLYANPDVIPYIRFQEMVRIGIFSDDRSCYGVVGRLVAP